MKTIEQINCLCTLVKNTAMEKNMTIEQLSYKSKIAKGRLNAFFAGDEIPTLEEIIMIGNVMDLTLTLHHSVAFAHQKIVRKKEHDNHF
jgi:transcriptional regulator with XRE-family HTH domain